MKKAVANTCMFCGELNIHHCKPKVSKEFVEKWVGVFSDGKDDTGVFVESRVIYMLKDAGVEVEK